MISLMDNLTCVNTRAVPLGWFAVILLYWYMALNKVFSVKSTYPWPYNGKHSTEGCFLSHCGNYRQIDAHSCILYIFAYTIY
jgi:hypothetical protein